VSSDQKAGEAVSGSYDRAIEQLMQVGRGCIEAAQVADKILVQPLKERGKQSRDSESLLLILSKVPSYLLSNGFRDKVCRSRILDILPLHGFPISLRVRVSRPRIKALIITFVLVEQGQLCSPRTLTPAPPPSPNTFFRPFTSLPRAHRKGECH
jgi:hypothetical protein